MMGLVVEPGPHPSRAAGGGNLTLWTPAFFTPIVRVVTKRNLFLAALLIEVVSWANGVMAGIIATLIVGAVYWLSLLLSPRDRHGRCGGTGQLHGVLFRHAFRKCPRCNSGRIIRFGAARWGLPHVRREAEATARARALARTEGRWR